MNKYMIISGMISISLMTSVLWFVSGKTGTDGNLGDTSAVSIVAGRQMIDILAKGGYSPRVIAAKSGLPSVLRVKTSGTFDCSASLVIPKLSYQKFLRPSGIEEIAISPEQAQGALTGLCAMGMYSFRVNFVSAS